MALIALSIAVHSGFQVTSAIQRALRGAEMGADLVEWRIDELGSAEDALAHTQQLVTSSPLPCIVTCRTSGEGGDYEGPEQQRLDLLVAVVASEQPPRYIDVELASFERDAHFRGRLRHSLEQSSRTERRTSLILSAHDFQGRPRDLMQKVEAMAAEPLCAIMKIAWHARSLRDNLEAFELLRARSKPMIALCMGQFGMMSRVLAGKFGGFLTFASDHATEVTAPGQPTIDELKRLYRFDRIGPATRVYGVIGWPVEHSRSPQFHNEGFERIVFDGAYLPLPIPGDPTEYEHFKATVGAMIDFAGLDFRGASVTIPHKENLVRFVKERGGRLDALSEKIGASNTLVVGSAGGLECVNTDAPAAIESLCAGANIQPDQLKSKRVAILGAGGVARAISAALLQYGAILTLFNRNAARARQLADDLARGFALDDSQINIGEAASLLTQRFDIYINCTPLGMAGGPGADQSPLPADAPLDESVIVMDTVYAPRRTPLIVQADSRGARVVLGEEMFRRQAARQFELWTRAAKAGLVT